MPKLSVVDRERLDRIVLEQHQVITRSQALAAGMPHSTIDYQVAPGRAWQVLLPGVYLTVTGTVTQLHRNVAALLYAGNRSVITGPAAVRLHQLRLADTDAVDVLVPLTVRRQNVGFVRLHRTTRMPTQWHKADGIRFAAATRAVADAARILSRFDDVRAVVCQAVQRRECTVRDLLIELDRGPAARSTLLRAALAEVSDGVRSVAEGDFRLLIIRGRLPVPMFNATLYTMDGQFIAMVDAWWEDAGVAVEIDSYAYHTSPEAQERDRDRHARLVKHGVLPLHFAPRRVKTDGEEILGQIRSAIEKGRQRPRLPIVAFPAEPMVPIK